MMQVGVLLHVGRTCSDGTVVQTTSLAVSSLYPPIKFFVAPFPDVVLISVSGQGPDDLIPQRLGRYRLLGYVSMHCSIK